MAGADECTSCTLVYVWVTEMCLLLLNWSLFPCACMCFVALVPVARQTNSSNTSIANGDGPGNFWTNETAQSPHKPIFLRRLLYFSMRSMHFLKVHLSTIALLCTTHTSVCSIEPGRCAITACKDTRKHLLIFFLALRRHYSFQSSWFLQRETRIWAKPALNIQHIM